MFGILQALFLFAAWSSIFPIGKTLLTISPPLFLTGARMLFAGMILLVYMLIRRPGSFKMDSKQWLSIGLLSLLSIYLTNILEFWSLEKLSAAKTCFIYSLSPFFTALLSYVHFKEKMTKKKWLGMLIGFLGFIPVLATQTGQENLFEAFSYLSWPEIAMMGAAFFGVYGWILLRICIHDRELSPLMANGMSMLFGGALALGHSYLAESWAPLPVAEGSGIQFARGIVLTTLISNIICYNLYGYLLKKFTATLLSFFGLLSPIFVTIISRIYLGETPSPAIIGSTFIVLFGLWIVYKEEIQQGYVQRAQPSKETQ